MKNKNLVLNWDLEQAKYVLLVEKSVFFHNSGRVRAICSPLSFIRSEEEINFIERLFNPDPDFVKLNEEFIIILEQDCRVIWQLPDNRTLALYLTPDLLQKDYNLIQNPFIKSFLGGSIDKINEKNMIIEAIEENLREFRMSTKNIPNMNERILGFLKSIEDLKMGKKESKINEESEE